jgi:FkbM family methyltransferase
MMNVFRLIQRPEYFFRPRQMWRRLRRNAILARNDVRMAWELPLEVGPDSIVGQDICNLGVYDRVVAEAICRLSDPGEQAFDIGANIGQNVSIMALIVGKRGRAVAFEPGDMSWRVLTKNVERWATYDLAPIAVVRKGVSSRNGPAVLHESVDFGQFSLEDHPPGTSRTSLEGSRGLEIELTTLDAFVSDASEIGLIKMDVEGHELAVLQGAKRLLGQKRIRDIVFEDFELQPSPVTLLLQAAGYAVFALFPAWRKPVLLTLDEYAERNGSYGPPNFLGTLDPDRAIARFQGAGWKCLKARAKRAR